MAVGGKVNFEVDNGRSIRQRENCEMCDKTEHDGYCSQCEIHVCQICFDNHRKSKLCRDHVLLQNADKSKIQNSGIRFDTCSEHIHQEVKLYCTEHKCFGCSECILVRHNLCNWEYIVEASNRFQDSGDLARLLEDVQSLEYTLDKYMETIDEHTTSAKTIDKDAVSDIETFAESLVEYIVGSKQQALDDANVRDSAHQQKLDKLKLDIQSLGSQVEEIITDFRDEDILHKRFVLAVETMPKLARIQNDVAAIDCNNVITGYTFRPGNFLKRMMSNTRPIGRLTDASQTGEDEEDDEFIKLKEERERSRGLDHQLKENQKMMSKLEKDVHDMEQAYVKVVKDKKCLEQDICTLKSENQRVVKDKQALTEEVCALKDTNQRIVKDKTCLEKDICTLKSENLNVVAKLNKDNSDLKQKYDGTVLKLGDIKLHQSVKVVKDKQSLTEEVYALKVTNQKVVKDKQCLEQDICTLKSEKQNAVSKLNKDIVDTKQKYEKIISKMKQELDDVKLHGPAVTLSCEHENLVRHFGENKLITCRTCGIINGDQPNGTFTTANDAWDIQLTFTFPDGTQSKLNRNPGQPYSGKTVKAFLYHDTEGILILKMMNIAFERKSIFTVDNHGNINNEVELLTYFRSLLTRLLNRYKEYIPRVKKQLEERGIKESDVTQL